MSEAGGEAGATLEPTPQRLARARREGDFGASGAPGAALSFLVLVLALPALARALDGASREALKAALSHAGEASPSALLEPTSFARDMLALAVPIVAAIAVVAATGTLVETRFGFAPRRIFRRGAGAGRAIAGPSARSFAYALAALGLGAYALAAFAVALVHTAGRGPSELMAHGGRLAVDLLRGGAGLVGVVAAIDTLLAARAHRASLRMTPRAVDEERKAAGGDPHVRAARKRAAQVALLEGPLAALVADHKACLWGERTALVLAWQKEVDAAPRVAAVRRGPRARALVDEAVSLSISDTYDPSFADELGASVAVGDVVPERHYEAVAALLA